MGESVRLSLKVSPSVAAAIRELAARRETTVTTVIRDAVSKERFLDEAYRSGCRFFLRAEDGAERELIWRTQEALNGAQTLTLAAQRREEAQTDDR
jgi:hypothetical protein